MDIREENKKREAALQVMGPLQAQANAPYVEWKAQQEAPTPEDKQKAIERIVIPNELRDGSPWTFRAWPARPGRRKSEFNDPRYQEAYCVACDTTFRYPVVYFVTYFEPNQWQVVWACPFGHPHVNVEQDRHIKWMLCEDVYLRLIESFREESVRRNARLRILTRRLAERRKARQQEAKQRKKQQQGTKRRIIDS